MLKCEEKHKVGSKLRFEKKLKVSPDKLRTSDGVPITDSPFYTTLQQSQNCADPFSTDCYAYFLSQRILCTDAKRKVDAFLKRAGEKKHSQAFDISVKIDQNGLFLVEKGQEDAAIAAFYGVPEVQARVVDRDRAWKRLVEKLWKVRRKKFSYLPICQPEEHPEFTDWEFARSPERRNILVNALGDLSGQRWLDVGSLTGYFARMLNMQGARVDAIELHKPYVEIASKLNKVENTRVNYILEDVVNWLKNNSHERYDGILCLSIIHNIAQSGRVEDALRTLRVLSTMAPRMFFDIGQRNEGGAVRKTGLDLRPENIEDFIRINTRYATVALIGKDEDYHNRQLFELRP